MKDLISQLQSMSPISLEQLNATMSLMERIDKKYLLHTDQLAELIKNLGDDYYVLNIQDKQIFSYDNVYMDTRDYAFYMQHQNGHKPRTKVRSRCYMDSNLAFFEFKQKNDEVTRKFRYQYEVENHGILNNEMIKFFEWLYSSFYNVTPKELIFPSFGTRYRRCTLCSKNNDERITIDFDITLTDLRSKGKKVNLPEIKLDNLAIIESKSTHITCKSHTTFADMGIQAYNKCSKYCMAMIYYKRTDKIDSFEKTIARVDEIRSTPSIYSNVNEVSLLRDGVKVNNK